MTSQVTQCPQCQTSFRVTEAQLNIANGSVRCGSCLHIFSAPEHWLNNPQPSPPKKKSIIEEQPSVVITKPTNGPDLNDLLNDTTEQEILGDILNDDIFADDDFDLLVDSDLDSDENNPPLSDTSELTSEFATEQTDNYDTTEIDVELTTSPPNDNNLIDDDDDFLISDTIINTDLDLESPTDQNDKEDTGFSDSFLQLNEAEDTPTAFKELDDLGGDEEAIKEEAWAQKLLEEEEEEEEYTSQSSTPEPEQTIEIDDTFSNLFDTLEDSQPVIDHELQDILDIQIDDDYNPTNPPAEEEFVLGNESMPAGDRIGHHISDNNQSLLQHIEPEPVFMAAPADHSQWVKRAWRGSIVIAVLIFIGQYLAFNFDRLARDQSYRPLLSSACHYLGCNIPSMDDIDQIRSSNLMVRSHPNAKQALVVDAIITNRADFQQHFPVMELQFTDLNGNIIAGRHFNPNEYLAGELSGSTMMPSKQPVHISLEIVDPGEQAVNYQLRFHSHQGS